MPAVIQWVPSPNCWPGGLDEVVAIVIHTMVGSLVSCDAEFQNAASQVSAHFGVGLDGTAHQYVNLADAAWANGSPNAGGRWTLTADNANRHTISIETEDLGRPDAQPVTDAQYAAVVSLCRQARLAHPSIDYLVAHEYINPNHSCPAARWLAPYAGGVSRFAQLAAELGLESLS